MPPPPVNQNNASEVDGRIARLGRLFLPPRCLVCGEPGARGHDLCAACQEALPWNRACCERCGLPMPVPAPGPGQAMDAVEGPVPTPGEVFPRIPACGRCLRKPPPLDRVMAAFRYGFPVDRLLPRFKFHQDLAAGRELAEAMRMMISRESSGIAALPEALIPVPLHPARLRERGYNQALELARPLAQAFDLPLLRDGLQRIRDTAPQSALGALARRRNPRGAFVTGSSAVPAHVALVDDVMTTGATLHECARVLKRAGVRRVDAWVAARVPAR